MIVHFSRIYRSAVRVASVCFLATSLSVAAAAVPASAAAPSESAAPAAQTKTGSVPQIGAVDLLKLIQSERGKVVVVNFFASWCPPCKVEIPELIALRESMPEADVAILGVSVDEQASELEAMVRETPFNYPVYHGVGDLPDFFKIEQIPRLLIYAPSGALKVNHIGLADPDALVEKIQELKKNN